MESVRLVEGRYGRLTPALYQQLAARTYQGGHLDQTTTILYHAMKIVEEVHEVYSAPPSERLHEIGDVLWHVAGLLSALGVTLNDVHLPKTPERGPAIDCAVTIGSMLAKHIGQGRDLDRKQLILLVIALMARLAPMAQAPWPVVMAENVLKLEKRYNIG